MLPGLVSAPPWYSYKLVHSISQRVKQDELVETPAELPDYVVALSDGTIAYEQKIKDAWEALKRDPTDANAQAFIDLMIVYSNEMWPEVLRDVLGVEELSPEQEDFLEEALDEHHGYMKDSLLPDIIKAIAAGTLSSLDFRTTFMYAGALWALGSVATVMFDGLELRDMADLFAFVGPNDEATCTGERGCAQHVGKVYTVAQILAENIIPGRLQCLTNCRHFLLPVASPLVNREKGLNGRTKHMPGRHSQSTHAPKRSRGTPVTRDWLLNGEGSKYLLKLSSDHKQAMAEILTKYGVHREDLEGLDGGFSTTPPEGYTYIGAGVMCRASDNKMVNGLYDIPSRTAYVSKVMLKHPSGHSVALHELGHHVVERDPAKAKTKAMRAVVLGSQLKHQTGNDPVQLADYGLRQYSLTDAYEFMADVYMAEHSGTAVQKRNLTQFLNSAGVDAIEDVYKEFGTKVLVYELQAQRVGSVIEIVPVEVEQDPAVVAALPWLYVSEVGFAEKHLPGRHDQRTHTPHKYRSGKMPVMKFSGEYEDMEFKFWSHDSQEAMRKAQEYGPDYQVIYNDGMHHVVKYSEGFSDYKLADSALVQGAKPYYKEVVDSLNSTAMANDGLFIDMEAAANNRVVRDNISALGAVSEKGWNDLRAAGGQVYVGEGSIVDLNDNQYLAGQQPRGWPPGSTYEQIDGAANGTRVFIGTVNRITVADPTMPIHEVGHALDRGYSINGSERWYDAHNAMLENPVRVNPYYTQSGLAGRQETWAQAFAVVQRAKQVGMRQSRLEAGWTEGAYDGMVQVAEEIVEERGW